MKKIKKLLSLMLVFVMGLGIIQTGQVCAYADAQQQDQWEENKITSLTYDVTAENITKEVKLTATTSDWQSLTAAISKSGNKELSLKLSGLKDGMVNMGYIYDEEVPKEEGGTDRKMSDANAQITVNKMVVNGKYEIPVGKTLKSGDNGLMNIWSGLSEGQKIYEGNDAYLGYDKNKELICLYTKTEGKDDSRSDTIKTGTRSMEYVKAMGSGWNLGNSMESILTDENDPDKGEESWGNPKVTKELLQAVKNKGFNCIRIPLTFARRYTVNENAKENEIKYVINRDYLNRAREIIDWALDDGFYVMTNIHHDSWIWLKNWDGDTSSEEYRMYTDFWKQLAETFKDESDKLCFETINEYSPEATGEMTANDKVMAVNKSAYDIIRQSGGKNGTRMIVIPSLYHNHEEANSSVLHDFLKTLDDENIIATVHYYSEWVYSANLGRTGFDEDLFGNGNYTPRDSVDAFMKTLREQFLSEGIGVITSEYGLLGYDQGENCLQTGEELKYYDYINAKARENNVCLMFWDNGSGINRESSDYSWKQENVGKTIEAAMKERISYATGLDTIYIAEESSEDISIPLTLNGNSFVGIEGLQAGKEYTYDEAKATVIIKKDYVNNLLKNASYGVVKTLSFQFSGGCDWQEKIVYIGTPVFRDAQGTKEGGIDIPVDFHGTEIRRITAYQAAGRVGPNSSWWNWLQNGGAFVVDYDKKQLSLNAALFTDSTVSDGAMKLTIEFYDGQKKDITLQIQKNAVTFKADENMETSEIKLADTVVLYAGETEIPAQYVTAPKGYKIYGIYAADESMMQLSGWPATITFDTKAHEEMTKAAVYIYYMDQQPRCDFNLGIKDAPIVTDVDVTTGTSKKVKVTNLAEDAVCSYKVMDTSVAQISPDGTVTGKSTGNTTVEVTVTQYGRTDTFTGKIQVTAASDAGSSSDSKNENQTTTDPSKDSDTEIKNDSSKKQDKVIQKMKKSVKLKKAKETVKAGKKTKIKCSSDLNMKYVKKITYTSKNKKIATVSKNGIVKAKKSGTTVIKVKITFTNGQTKTLTFKIKVK